MYSDINERLEENRQGIARLHKIDAILQELESEQRNLKRREKELKVILEKENQDVEKLEHTSMASLFYAMLGSLDEHVEKERREALAAQLKYEQMRKDLEDIKDQITKLSAERSGYLECQKKYDRLYVQKREILLRENGETAQKILELTDKLNLAKVNLKEINEALSAGNAVLDSLNRVLGSLDSAEGWGTWDLIGGGLLTDLAKHSHIDDAKAETVNTQRLLRNFRTELTDIKIDSEIVMETDGFGKFADFFFDGLIADWFMQSRIHESQSSTEEVRAQVLSVMNKLEHMKTQEIAILKRLEADISELIVKA
ncbi:hypothetical protein [Paradesulfitobacterium ferrireducens]|uniref:hypothetical protein n=1 Tax=Paradesulfitobacterium ferrireducens TaxID=2816476 RepID=UPI001A8CAB45|nr:hypothetical protein [Paradesulfitobacterium ferrireducens]